MLTKRTSEPQRVSAIERVLRLQNARLVEECERLKRAWMQESARAEEFQMKLRGGVAR